MPKMLNEFVFLLFELNVQEYICFWNEKKPIYLIDKKDQFKTIPTYTHTYVFRSHFS